MNKQEAIKQAEVLQAELAKLQAIIAEPEHKGLWVPPRTADYWSIIFPDARKAGLDQCANYDDRSMEPEHKEGRVFKTREAAETALPLIIKQMKYINAALQADPDAGEYAGHDRNWAAYKDMSGWRHGRFFETCSYPIYVRSQEACERWIEILKAEGM